MSMGLFSIYSRLGAIKMFREPKEMTLAKLASELSRLQDTLLAEELYGATAWEAWEEVVGDTEILIGSEGEVTQQEIDDAYEALTEAYDALTGFDKTELSDYIDLIDSEIESEEFYAPSRWSVYETNRLAANAVMAAVVTTQHQINTALADLENSYEALVPYADRNDLTNLIIYIGTNIGPEEDYTPETWGPFALALAAGIAARDNDVASQQEIDDATDDLNNAMVALEEVA